MIQIVDEAQWKFDDIALIEPVRAERLESVVPEELTEELEKRLHDAITQKSVRVAVEHARKEFQDLRAIFQFHIGAELFDSFFNSRSGYRAHFRRSPRSGLDFNDLTVARWTNILLRSLPEVTPGRQFAHDFEDVGPCDISKAFLKQSLVPYFSKIWVCTKQINETGGTSYTPPQVSGPRLLVGGERWTALEADQENAWLDVKGAFIGKSGAYQLKDPECRAIILQKTGTA